MYVPKHFQVKDQQEIERFLMENPFAILFSHDQEAPIATHIPLQLEKRKDKLVFTGHMAYANPHWRIFEHNSTVLAVFPGPHAYVSASWYGNISVPTWNYMAVHVYGKVRIVEEQRLREMLKDMLKTYEAGRENEVLWERLPDDFVHTQIKGIVGFEIEAERLEAKYKISQNRNEEDYQSVIRHLEATAEDDARKLAETMKRIGKDL